MKRASRAAAIHLPGLNGLRALAAVAVVVSHLRLSLRQFGLEPRPGLLLAQYGVTVFFALSGFLITYLLLKEREATGQIHIGRFYVRRILRIWPLYYLYFGIALIVGWLALGAAAPRAGWLYVALLPNIPFILNQALPFLDHYWSLGVEEQFYAIWPLVLTRLKKPFIPLVIFLVVFMSGKTVAGYVKFRTGWDLPWVIFGVNRFDCMILGALGGLLAHEGHARFMRVSQQPVVQTIAWGILGAIALEHFDVHPLVNHEIAAVATTIAVINLAFNPRTLVSLEYPIFDFIGKISYGVYVYHPLVIAGAAVAARRALGDLSPGLLSEGVLTLAVVSLTIGTAWVSYVAIERPFLGLKERFSVIRTAPNLAGTG